MPTSIAHPDTPLPPTSPRWQRRAEARPEEILLAAMQTFVERGFAATRLDDVAARAGVSKGTLYLYYTSKEALFQAAVKASIVPHIQSGEQFVAEFQGPALVLLRELYERWGHLLADPILSGVTKLMIAESANFPDTARFYVDAVVLRSRAMFVQVVQKAISEGSLRAMPAGLIVRELLTPVIFTAVWRHSLASYDPNALDYPTYLTSHFEIVLRSLQPLAGDTL